MTEFPETQTSLLASIKTLDDRHAWERFVLLYRPVIYRIARRKGLQPADAEDLTQHVLTSIAGSIERWKKSNPSARFRYWLRRVVKNAIINAATRKRPEIPFSAISSTGEWEDYQLLAEPAINNEAEIEIENEYRRQLFQRAAAVVKSDIEPTTWRAFEMTVIEDMPIKSAADELNKSIGSVYAARSRVMHRLKAVVETWEDKE